MGSYNSRRMVDDDSRSQSSSDDDSTSEVNYSYILQSLINSGQVHIMASEFDNYYDPPRKFKHKPNTAILDKSEFSVSTKQACGLASAADKFTGSNITKMLMFRERGLYTNTSFSYSNRCRINNNYLPNQMYHIDTYGGKVFCGIFSKDGNYFLTASQDRQIQLYQSGNGSYKFLNKISARDVGWSIIDVAFSPDQESFVYSSWSTALHQCSINGDSEQQEPLCLVNTGRRFCIFSVFFSSDGKEILGGANDGCLYIYDRQRHERTHKILAHEYDVNSVAFADETSHIIYSGADDGLVKVWDRRTLNDGRPKPVGVLAGHMDGVTYIDSRGDGRHLISNSKDQSIKLWDIRRFSSEAAINNTLRAVHEQTWDYRWQEVPKKLYSSKTKLEGDSSIMTYRGHIVIKTLVRCRFSPVETTGQRYIYTGCGVGRVVIYDALTGKMVDLSGHSSCVRDVAWHPHRNEILSSSWDGSVGKWYYNDILDDDSDEEDPVLRKRTSDGQCLRRSKRIAQLKRKKQRAQKKN